MKTSLLTVALVAVASSLVTVGVVELLRGSLPHAQPALAGETSLRPSPSEAARKTETLAPAARAREAPHADLGTEDRLAELERRIAALELGAGARRAPVSPETAMTDELPQQTDLRDLVLEWVAEEREARRRAMELQEEEEQRRELEFDARYQALELAEEHGLEKWQQEEFAQLFLEIGLRAWEVERGIDLETDDPEAVEARWTEYDEWVDQRERELTALLDPELYQKIYGDDEDED